MLRKKRTPKQACPRTPIVSLRNQAVPASNRAAKRIAPRVDEEVVGVAGEVGGGATVEEGLDMYEVTPE